VHIETNILGKGEPGATVQQQSGYRVFDVPYRGPQVAHCAGIRAVGPEDPGDIAPGSHPIEGEDGEHPLLPQTEHYLAILAAQRPPFEQV
jgi:hypothetical protein